MGKQLKIIFLLSTASAAVKGREAGIIVYRTLHPVLPHLDGSVGQEEKCAA